MKVFGGGGSSSAHLIYRPYEARIQARGRLCTRHLHLHEVTFETLRRTVAQPHPARLAPVPLQSLKAPHEVKPRSPRLMSQWAVSLDLDLI